jgi:hypothetical protein
LPKLALPVRSICEVYGGSILTRQKSHRESEVVSIAFTFSIQWMVSGPFETTFGLCCAPNYSFQLIQLLQSVRSNAAIKWPSAYLPIKQTFLVLSIGVRH